jgi:hypothetical protein
MLLSLLPFSVGLPKIDHLLLRWVVDVADLHKVLLHRFLLCPPRLLVMTQTVLEVVPDVHSLLLVALAQFLGLSSCGKSVAISFALSQTSICFCGV